MLNANELRREYRSKELDLKDLEQDPFLQFNRWFNDAINAQVIEPNAMILATCNAKGKPSSRTVLLKYADKNGIIFFTNYESKKAKDIEANPFVSVTFFWAELGRQVIIEGTAEKTTEEESTAYFAKRPKFSQIASWASHQDQIIDSRENLQKEFNYYCNYFKDKEVPKPPFWGGFKIIPNRYEFWQGRENRLHDRFVYSSKDHLWQIARISP